MHALADCNNFYVSCERVFRPDLKGKPVIVLSNNDGCVVSRSNEAKKLGIPMGAPYFEVEAIIKAHEVEVFSSNFELYGDMSRRVMMSLDKYFGNIEVYSIDEAFINLRGMEKESLSDFCRYVQKQVEKETSIPISIGIGETKTIAKLANEYAKKNSLGVYNSLQKDNWNQILMGMNVSEVWGVGRSYNRLLTSMGIRNIYDLKHLSNNSSLYAVFIRKTKSNGEHIMKELNGINCSSLHTIVDTQKSIMSTRSFGSGISRFNELQEAVASYSDIICRKLRSKGLVATNIGVFIHTSRFKPDYTFSYKTCLLPYATNSTPALIAESHALLKEIFVEGREYKKAGVMAWGLVRQKDLSEDLLRYLDPMYPKTLKEEQAMKAMDYINKRLNSELRIASTGMYQKWKSKAQLRSHRYTTRWAEILTIRID